MHDISGTLYQTFVQIDPPQFGDLVAYLGEFLLFFDYRNFEAL